MKNLLQLTLVMTLAALPLGAQTTTRRHTSSSSRTTHRTAVRRSLLHPASLNERAPATYKAKFTTTKGDFVIEVTRAWAPIGADRFYNLVKYHFFDDAPFFRVVPGFVVQFGISSKPAIAQRWAAADLKDEPATQKNLPGYVTYAAMPTPNTRSTQVFINLRDNSESLDPQGFAPFGKVIEGMDVVERLYSGYGENGPDQERLAREGKAYVAKNFPQLDSIKMAVIEGGPAPAAAHRTAAAAHPKSTAKSTAKSAANRSAH